VILPKKKKEDPVVAGTPIRTKKKRRGSQIRRGRNYSVGEEKTKMRTKRGEKKSGRHRREESVTKRQAERELLTKKKSERRGQFRTRHSRQHLNSPEKKTHPGR